MNDEETVALIAGGHTFGKCHGNGDPSLLGPEPEGCPVEHQGFGWSNANGTGKGKDTITSGLEGAWTPTPVTWDNSYFETLFGYEWELAESPAGAKQWHPKDGAGSDAVPDAHDASVRHAPMMLTSDLALRLDPVYEPISRRFLEHPDELALAFAKAWYKLLHRDMGPVSRYLGPWVAEAQLWQDPVPAVDHELVDDADVAALKARCWRPDCRSRSWSGRRGRRRPASAAPTTAAAPTVRGSGWSRSAAGRPTTRPPWRRCCRPSRASRRSSTTAAGGKRISLADLIVLAGGAAIEQAAAAGGHTVTVPFAPGRTDASQDQTDVEAFAVLEPQADGFRNYLRAGEKLPPETLLLDRANLLRLTAPEMTVLVGGLRALGANTGGTSLGVLTDRPGTLTNDVFVNLLDMATEWRPSESAENVYDGRDRVSGEPRWTGNGGRPGVRVALPAPGAGRGVCQRRRARRSSSRTSWRRGSR